MDGWTSICKSDLRFVICGIFTQLNEDSDSDQFSAKRLHTRTHARATHMRDLGFGNDNQFH